MVSRDYCIEHFSATEYREEHWIVVNGDGDFLSQHYSKFDADCALARLRGDEREETVLCLEARNG